MRMSAAALYRKAGKVLGRAKRPTAKRKAATIAAALEAGEITRATLERAVERGYTDWLLAELTKEGF
jgi:hypothetical protein